MFTPLIKTVNRNTLITFPSALEDWEIIGQSDKSKEVYFSHFALLDIPDIAIPVNRKNNIDFSRIETVAINGLNVGANEIGDKFDFSESLQNYLLNFESILTEQEWYDKNILKNSNESIFWKWMKEVGAMRFRSANNNDSTKTNKFTEELPNTDNAKPLYNRVVQYVGSIGTQNSTKGRKNSFKEIYIMIPSDSGSTPTVLFESISNSNYFPSMVVQNDLNRDFINGYDSDSELPPTGLDLRAHYDRDVIGVDYSTTDSLGNATDNWFDYNQSPDSYCTEEIFSNPSNEIITRIVSGESKEIYRSKLDGVNLDLNFDNYTHNQNINGFESFNKTVNARSFDFNAIMLYYTVVDILTGEKATNLYGLAIVGDIEEYSAGISRVGRSKKIKNDAIVGNVGNGMSFRFNFKLSARQESITPKIEVDFNEQTNLGMQLFSTFMAKSTEILSNYENIIQDNIRLSEENSYLRDFLGNIDYSNVNKKVEEVLQLVSDFQQKDVNGELLESLNKRITEVLTGKTSVEVTLLLKLIEGNGIKSSFEDGQLKIENTRQEYSEVEDATLDVSISNDNVFSIGSSKKLLLLSNIEMPLDSTINLKLNNSNKWKIGQTIEIVSKSLIEKKKIVI